MKVIFSPYSDRVTVKPDESANQTKAGIIILDTSKKKPCQGTVLATGPGKDGVPTEAKVGHRVYYSAYAGIEMEINGEKFLIMRDSDIFGVLETSDVPED